MDYSNETKRILLRWQSAKTQYDLKRLADASRQFSDEVTEFDKKIEQEYWNARQALDSIQETELVVVVKQANPELPGVNLKTPEGHAVWCKLERSMLAAEQKLFEISLGITDLFPQISKRIQ